MLILNKRNDILGWQDSGGVDILFPQQRVGEKLRGGAFPCLPQFGNVPTTKPGWSDIKLPRHGLWRLENYGSEPVIYTRESHQCQVKTYRQPEGFPYDFTAKESFRLIHLFEETILDYTVTVLRDVGCRNNNFMPWMPGWHPYFATHGAPFEAWVGRTIPLTEDTPLNRAAAYDFFGQPIKLLTQHHEFEFFFGRDTNQVVVWTDDKTKYVCIEPVSLDLRLDKGESSSMTSRICVKPRK